jgi:hypothetical protein
MASSDYRQVTTVLRRLGGFLNPVGLLAGLADVAREVSVPPPGDPAALDRLAQAYSVAAEQIPVARQAFQAAAEALAELATATREQQRRHAELRDALAAAIRDATHVGGVPMLDPTAVDDVLRVVTGLVAVYTASLDAADRAASRFADLTGRARLAAASAGGFAPAEAIMLAGQCLFRPPDGGPPPPRVSVAGIGDEYDDGILTPAQLTAAGERRAGLGDAERAAFTALLDESTSDLERAWLYKALAAGHGLDELESFARTIRGKDAGWLDGHLSLIDRGGTGEQVRQGVDVRQYEDTTCGTTSLIVAHADADPLYALSLTGHDFAARFKAERDRVHDETNLLWPEAFGTSPKGMAGYLNARSAVLGAAYGWRLVDDTNHREISATMREVVTAADRGHPVPVLVGGPVPRHYILVVGHSGGDVLIYEPTGGDTVRVAEPDFLTGNLRGTAGFAHVQAVVVPT